MANVKISELTALASPGAADVLPIVDVVASTTKKATVSSVVATGAKALPRGTAGAPAVAFNGALDPNTGIYSPGADQLALSTNGTGRLFVDASGNVGINLSSSLGLTGYSGMLRIRPASSGAAGFFADNGAGDSWFGCYGGTSSADSAALIYPSTGSLRIATTTGVGVGGFNERLRIGSTGTITLTSAASTAPFIANIGATEVARVDSSGRLLVGMTSAITTVSNGLTSTSQISLAGTTTSTANIGTSIFVNNASAASSLSLSKSRNTVVGSHAILLSNDRIGSISYSGSDGTNFIEAARISCDVDGTLGQTAGTLTIGQTYRILTTGTTDFTLIGAANSNTGTTFTATGAGTGTGTAINTAGDMPGRLVFSTSADNSGTPTERLRITSAGLVGIGTSAPDSTLNVRAGANNTTAEEIASFSRPDASVRAAISKGLISGTTNGIALGTTTNHPFALNTNGSERLYITNAGNVGIGTTSPGGTLDIKAAASTAPLIVQGPSNEFARITNDGVQCYNQAAPASYAAAATLVIGDLKTGLVQYTGGAATLTLPTGTLTEGGFSGVYTNMTFEWSVINTGSGTCTIGDGTGHTVTGRATVDAGASGRFASRRTAANTFVSYRLS